MTPEKLTWILQLITTLAIGGIGFWLKDWKSKTEAQIKQNECDIKNVEKSLNDLKTQMPYNYTLREDHIRAMANLEKRLEKMDENVSQNLEKINSKMEQKLDGYFSNFSQKIDKLEEHLNEHILRKEG